MKARLARWSLTLQEYKFKIEHIKGTTNASDHLSREFACSMVKTGMCKEVTSERGRELIIFYHDLLGHGSAQNLRYHLLKKYTWKGAAKDIKEFVDKCIICQKNKSPTKQSDCSPIVAGNKNDLWEIDVVGPLPLSERGYRYILTMIDHCTKCAEIVPLRTKSMEEVRDAVNSSLIGKHGVPVEILSDNGKEFSNAAIERLCEKYGIIWKYGSPYNPTTTGLVERFNRTLMSKLRKITEFGKFDWERCLLKAWKGYMYSYHRAIGCTPFELERGQLITEMDKQEGIKEGKKREWFIDIHKETKARYVDSYRSEGVHKSDGLKVGDTILYTQPCRTMGKLESTWTDVGKIIEVRYNSYMLKLRDGRVLVANKKHVKILNGEECWSQPEDQMVRSN
ncbi:Transposon Tf2-6 polyprotein [Nosema granulosis]|uniref:Transposon Tf2-6 polyprotein n=1 Tax=Nosema granulosis TaxID=83296 RepID=A0A9P6KX26_9MICR|nr:Transposon Tf2-6 polyprotein [Nosema granulosis]